MYQSDHCFVEMEINIKRSNVVFKMSTYRNWKKADMEKICAQLADLDKKLNYDTECLREFLEDYQDGLNNIINELVPEKHQRYMCIMWCNPGLMLILEIKRSKCITVKGAGENIGKTINGKLLKWKDQNT